MQLVCPILGTETEVEPTQYSREPWVVVRCRTTDLVFLANPPSYSQLAEQFAWEKTWQEESQRRRADQPIVSRLSSLAKLLKTTLLPRRDKMLSLVCQTVAQRKASRTIRFLDIGCGGGTLMQKVQQRLQSKGRQAIPMGIEVSKQLASIAQAKIAEFGGKVLVQGSVDGVMELETGGVDLVIMSSFLEHEFQPLRLFRELRRVLDPDGSIVLKVPNFACWNRIVRGRKWSGFRYPDHVSYFTPHTLAALAKEESYTVSRQGLRDKFPLSDNMYAVLKKAA
jgi:SAM-dependent methyltransferase